MANSAVERIGEIQASGGIPVPDDPGEKPTPPNPVEILRNEYFEYVAEMQEHSLAMLHESGIVDELQRIQRELLDQNRIKNNLLITSFWAFTIPEDRILAYKKQKGVFADTDVELGVVAVARLVWGNAFMVAGNAIYPEVSDMHRTKTRYEKKQVLFGHKDIPHDEDVVDKVYKLHCTMTAVYAYPISEMIAFAPEQRYLAGPLDLRLGQDRMNGFVQKQMRFGSIVNEIPAWSAKLTKNERNDRTAIIEHIARSFLTGYGYDEETIEPGDRVVPSYYHHNDGPGLSGWKGPIPG